MSGYLLLGPVLFQDFELPERIAWGGEQRLAVHCLPGGARVIDALGRDDAQIAWSGVFSGSNAAIRARLVDLLRAGGAVWPLTWNTFFYSVIIRLFEAEYTRSNWIPYRIACTVVRDEAEALVETATSLGAGILADLSAASAASTGLDFTAATFAVSARGATTSGSAAYTSASAALRGSAGQIATSISGAESGLSSASLGTAAGLTQATGAAGQLAALTNAGGYVNRAQVNLLNASN
jgi:hypothetical protein